MDHLSTKNSLLEKLEFPDFAIQTQRQIEKDFATCGLSFNPDFIVSSCSYRELNSIVENHIKHLMNSDTSLIRQLLYQVDIPESDFNALLDLPDFESALSELIIIREAFKVYLRSKF